MTAQGHAPPPRSYSAVPGLQKRLGDSAHTRVVARVAAQTWAGPAWASISPSPAQGHRAAAGGRAVTGQRVRHPGAWRGGSCAGTCPSPQSDASQTRSPPRCPLLPLRPARPSPAFPLEGLALGRGRGQEEEMHSGEACGSGSWGGGGGAWRGEGGALGNLSSRVSSPGILILRFTFLPAEPVTRWKACVINCPAGARSRDGWRERGWSSGQARGLAVNPAPTAEGGGGTAAGGSQAGPRHPPGRAPPCSRAGTLFRGDGGGRSVVSLIFDKSG